MQYSLMVVDDSPLILEMIEAFLTENRYSVTCFSSPNEALEKMDEKRYDCILSDFFMPGMNGDRFFREVRIIDPGVPFIFMSTNEDIRIAIELMRMGADDYITKPIIKDALLFRIEKTILDYKNRNVLERVRKEQEIRKYEEDQIVNWRKMYAERDIEQTGRLIQVFSRLFNQSGIRLLLDVFRGKIEKADEENYKIDSRLADLLIRTLEKQDESLSRISLISEIDSVSLSEEKVDCSTLDKMISQMCNGGLADAADKYRKKLTFNCSETEISESVIIDRDYLKLVVKELFWNAVKYSPRESEISISCRMMQQKKNKFFLIVMHNAAQESSEKDIHGENIKGIPLEYSELVFDIFYRIDSADPLPEEEWPGGTGLYLARKILKRQNAWINASNILDYSGGKPETRVQLTITIPVAGGCRTGKNL